MRSKSRKKKLRTEWMKRVRKRRVHERIKKKSKVKLRFGRGKVMKGERRKEKRDWVTWCLEEEERWEGKKENLRD